MQLDGHLEILAGCGWLLPPARIGFLVMTLLWTGVVQLVLHSKNGKNGTLYAAQGTQRVRYRSWHSKSTNLIPSHCESPSPYKPIGPIQ